MNSIDAAHAVVHDYPGGSESLGPRVGISPAVLRNKVNPNNCTHHLTFAEARRIADMTNDFRALQAWAHEAGFLLVKAPEGNACDMAVLEQVVGLGVANGQFLETVSDTLEDGKVEKEELERVLRAQHKVQTAAATVTIRLETLMK